MLTGEVALLGLLCVLVYTIARVALSARALTAEQLRLAVPRKPAVNAAELAGLEHDLLDTSPSEWVRQAEREAETKRV